MKTKTTVPLLHDNLQEFVNHRSAVRIWDGGEWYAGNLQKISLFPGRVCHIWVEKLFRLRRNPGTNPYDTKCPIIVVGDLPIIHSEPLALPSFDVKIPLRIIEDPADREAVAIESNDHKMIIVLSYRKDDILAVESAYEKVSQPA